MQPIPFQVLNFECYLVADLHKAVTEAAFKSYKPLVLPGVTGLLPFPLEIILVEEITSIDAEGNPVRSFLNKTVSVQEVYEQEDPKGDIYYTYILHEDTHLQTV